MNFPVIFARNMLSNHSTLGAAMLATAGALAATGTVSAQATIHDITGFDSVTYFSTLGPISGAPHLEIPDGQTSAYLGIGTQNGLGMKWFVIMRGDVAGSYGVVKGQMLSTQLAGGWVADANGIAKLRPGGQLIGHTRFTGEGGSAAWAIVATFQNSGAFRAVGGAASGYIGFKNVPDASHVYYGWLKVKVTSDGNGLPVSVDVVANSHGNYGAYGLASTGIVAGQDSISTPVPEPATVATGLGLCALGAMGVREWRRRRAAQKAEERKS